MCDLSTQGGYNRSHDRGEWKHKGAISPGCCLFVDEEHGQTW